MRKNIWTIVIYIVCLSIFSFSLVPSFSTPYNDIYPTTALLDLIATENGLRDFRDNVQDAWAVVDMITLKWDNMIDENRRKTVMNFLIEMMGTGFWATAGGLGGRIESEFKSYYANLSLMDLYSDELENVKSEIDLFYTAVKIYQSSHKNATRVVNLHKSNNHTQANMHLHSVPTLKTKTCRDSLPSFSCKGNNAAGKTVCNDSYNTPRKAIKTHRENCGEEVDSDGYKTKISGDGFYYYTCDTEAYDKHRVRNCTRDFKNGEGVTNTCGDGFRRCVGHKKDHDLSNIFYWESKHSDESNSAAAAGDSADAGDDSSTSTIVCNIQGCTLTDAYDPSDATAAALHAYCDSCYLYKCNGSDHSAASCGISDHHVCDNNSHAATACGHSLHFVCDSLTHVEEQCTNVSNGVRCRYKFWRCLHPNVPSYGPSHTCDYSVP